MEQSLDKSGMEIVEFSFYSMNHSYASFQDRPVDPSNVWIFLSHLLDSTCLSRLPFCPPNCGLPCEPGDTQVEIILPHVSDEVFGNKLLFKRFFTVLTCYFHNFSMLRFGSSPARLFLMGFTLVSHTAHLKSNPKCSQQSKCPLR